MLGEIFNGGWERKTEFSRGGAKNAEKMRKQKILRYQKVAEKGDLDSLPRGNGKILQELAEAAEERRKEGVN